MLPKKALVINFFACTEEAEGETESEQLSAPSLLQASLPVIAAAGAPMLPTSFICKVTVEELKRFLPIQHLL